MSKELDDGKGRRRFLQDAIEIGAVEVHGGVGEIRAISEESEKGPPRPRRRYDARKQEEGEEKGDIRQSIRNRHSRGYKETDNRALKEEKNKRVWE